MMDWSEYIAQILARNSSFDGLRLSFGDDRKSIGVPPLIKASVLMLDRMLECQGKFNILVFPERIQSIFIFTLVKLLYNIAEGRIECAYDPESFQAGEHLKLGKAVVEFVGIEEHNDVKRVKIKLADLRYSAPIEFFPLFQKTTAQRLSKYDVFAQAMKEAKAQLRVLSTDERFLKLLADYKTHMDSSIVNMTTVINTKELITSSKLWGKNVKDLILVGQADYEGHVKNIGAGQLGGTPAIVLASDLYAISQMVQNGHPVQSIIIDGSNANILLSQMDALDELMHLGVPITCVTDVVNSFDLQSFLDRNFNIWRWDEKSITEKLYNANTLAADLKTKHCAQRKVDYLLADGNEISTAIRLLSLHKGEAQTFSAPMLKLCEKLFSLSFDALWETAPFDDCQLARATQTLTECKNILLKDKPFLAEKTYQDYETVIACLVRVHSKDFKLPKQQMLSDFLKKRRNQSIYLVVSERCDKKRVQDYWQTWCRRNLLNITISVRSPSEYYLLQSNPVSSTIVVGWFKRAIMRKLLFSFNTKDYTVLLYDYEKRWKNHTTYRWNKALDASKNRETIEKSFATDRLKISTTRFEPAADAREDIIQNDEYAEIEGAIRENKFRRFTTPSGHHSSSEPVEALPVNYVGGYLAFYRMGHKLISATKIITEDAERIEMVLPEKLNMGDFVVVRETDRDLIREMADIILAESGMSDLREMASKWREALEIETLFYTPEEIYQRLQNAGCTLGFPSVKRWLDDEDLIAPQSKEDLKHLAEVTGSSVLKELLDQVYEAAQVVRAAHSKAGKELSNKLRNRIVEALQEYEDIDPFNIWEPIEMQVDGIGTVRILKIIDIGGSSIWVDRGDTNRLIDEE